MAEIRCRDRLAERRRREAEVLGRVARAFEETGHHPLTVESLARWVGDHGALEIRRALAGEAGMRAFRRVLLAGHGIAYRMAKRGEP